MLDSLPRTIDQGLGDPSTSHVARLPDTDRARRLLTSIHRGGQELSATVMFMDVRNFTQLSRERCPREVVRTLNRLFGLAVPLITARSGYVDKFIGDGLMAVFGVPHRAPDHADRALAAALAIKDCVGQKLDGWVDIGVGLDSGTVLAAIVGGGDRLDLTIVGHVVNMAAHVETSTRETGDTILLTQRTRQLLTVHDVDPNPRITKVSGEPGLARLYAPSARSQVRLETVENTPSRSAEDISSPRN